MLPIRRLISRFLLRSLDLKLGNEKLVLGEYTYISYK